MGRIHSTVLTIAMVGLLAGVANDAQPRAVAAPAPADIEGWPSASVDASDAFSAQDWIHIREKIREVDLELTWRPATLLPDVPAAWQALNYEHALRAYFTAAGVSILPNSGTTPDWRASLSVQSYGRGNQRAALHAVEPEAKGNRVEYRRAGLREWYVNDARGLEHGFDVEERPGGTRGDLVIELALATGLKPEIDAQGAGLVLRDDEGRIRFRYAGLKAWDADERALPSRMALGAGRDGTTLLALYVDDADARYPIVVDPIASAVTAETKAWTVAMDDQFGYSVAISQHLAVVGVPYADDDGADSGAVYVLYRNDAGPYSWDPFKKILPDASDAGAGDQFGHSVSLSLSHVLVGAPGDDDPTAGSDAGSAYVFSQNQGGSNAFGQVVKRVASNADAGDMFGVSVDISGKLAVVGASVGDSGTADVGAAYVFGQDAGGTDNWGEIKRLNASGGSANDEFGASVAISRSRVIVGAPAADTAYIFDKDNGGSNNWGQVKAITGSDTSSGDNFGAAVGVSKGIAVVGAPDHSTGNGAAYVFYRNFGGADNWGQRATLTGGTGGKFGLAVGISGDVVVVGEPDGDPSSVGPGAGWAYIYARDEGGANNWGFAGNVFVGGLPVIDVAGGDHAGFSVSLGRRTVLIGAPSNDDGATDSGKIFGALLDPDCSSDSADVEHLVSSYRCGQYGLIFPRQVGGGGGEEIVSLDYSVHEPTGTPKGVVLLLPGGSGSAFITSDGGSGVATSSTNFLIRSAQMFADRGYRAISVDRSSDRDGDSNGQFDNGWRTRMKAAVDLASILNAENPEGYDVFLAGTSRGANTVASNWMIGTGISISSGVTKASGGTRYVSETADPLDPNVPTRNIRPSLVAVPVHYIVEQDDLCSTTPPANAAVVFADFTGLDAMYSGAGVSNQMPSGFTGSFTGEQNECNSVTHHGFAGIENAAVQSTTDFFDSVLSSLTATYPGNTRPTTQSVTIPAGVDPITIDLAMLTSEPDGDGRTYAIPYPHSSRRDPTTDPSNISLSGSMLTYSHPGSGFKDTLAYIVNDGKGGTAPGVITIDRTARGDFDKNGRSDIMWRRSDTGGQWFYFMTGMTLDSEAAGEVIGTDWTVAGIGDFDGNGATDLFYRRDNGATWIKLMNGAAVDSEGAGNFVSPSWVVVGVGDFNGDGRDDLMWRNTVSGATWFYFMNGLAILDQGPGEMVDPAWEVVGIGDFDRNGRDDVLWRRASGALWIHLMDGLTVALQGSAGFVSPDWVVSGIGDFDGNGTSDIHWRHPASGATWFYFMDGLTLDSDAAGDTVSPAWSVAAVRDFNFDGKDDLFWRRPKAGLPGPDFFTTWFHLMNGATVASQGAGPVVGDVWQVVNP